MTDSSPIGLFVDDLLPGQAHRVIVGAVHQMEWLLNITLISMIILPYYPFFFFFLTMHFEGKKYTKLKEELFESKMLAEDIIALGKEHGIDLFNTALDARCFHELGMKGVPEWCFRNSELPEKKE